MLKHVWEIGREEHECGRGVDKLFKIRSLEPRGEEKVNFIAFCFACSIENRGKKSFGIKLEFNLSN